VSLIIVGSMAFDTIETPLGRREKIVGGSGTYCSLAAGYFTRPGIVGVVGRDFPKKTLTFLESRNVDIRGVSVKAGKTFHWEGRYGRDPNQRTTVRTELNVFQNFRPVLPPEFRTPDILFLANIDPDVHPEILSQIKKPRLTAMDTIRFWIETKPEALLREIGRVDILFANDEEVRMIADEINLIRAAKKLLDRGPSIIVAKKGEHGVLIFERDFLFGVPAHPCENVVDPTGAGDSFAGGFLGYLEAAGRVNRGTLRRTAVYGSALASFAIEDFGAERFSTLSRDEIEARYLSFRRLTSF